MFIPYVIPKTRKGMKIVLLILLVICIAGTVVAYISWAADQKILRENGQPDFNTLPQDKLKSGLIVKGTIDVALDSYAEMYKTDDFGKRSSDESEYLYYLVPVYNANSDGSMNIGYIITFRAGPDDFDAMNKILEQTWSNTNETTALTVENADIVYMPDDIKKYLNDWAHDPEIFEGSSFIDWCIMNDVFGTGDRAVIESKLVPYMIIRTSTAGTSSTAIWGMLSLSVIILAILLFLIFHKAPIKGVEDPPAKDDFNKVREFAGE